MLIGMHEEKFWREGKFMCASFRRDMKIYLYNGADEDYAEACVNDFNRLSPELSEAVGEAAKRFCAASLNDWAEIDKREEIEAKMSLSPSPETPPEKFLKLLRPVSMSVREPEGEELGYEIEFDCDWAPDTGAEAVVRGGKLLYFGPFGDRSPWDDLPENDPRNYAASNENNIL